MPASRYIRMRELENERRLEEQQKSREAERQQQNEERNVSWSGRASLVASSSSRRERDSSSVRFHSLSSPSKSYGAKKPSPITSRRNFTIDSKWLDKKPAASKHYTGISGLKAKYTTKENDSPPYPSATTYQARKAAPTKEITSDSDDDFDARLLASFDQQPPKKASPKTPPPTRKQPPQKYASLDSSDVDEALHKRERLDKSLTDDSSDEEDSSPSRKGEIRNPITLEKEERAKFAALNSRPKPTIQNDVDDLWDMSEPEEQPEKKKKVKPKKVKNVKPNNPTKRRSGSSLSYYHKKSRQFRNDFDEDEINNGYYDDRLCFIDQELRQLIEQKDLTGLESMAHPFLEFPSFESNFESLEMGKGESRHLVPASLSRYLFDYQKEGVRFLHNCLTKRMGSVLGDEMGLGKTVQVISLLSALYKKTGTGLDCLQIVQRWKLVHERRKAIKKDKDNAIQNGKIFVEPEIDLSDLNLPAIYPVLLIVPTSLLENWKAEFEFWSHFSVAVFYTSSRDRQLEKLRDGRAELLIVPDSLFQKEDTFQQLNEIKWKLVIIDEFHKFRNKLTKVSKHLRTLKSYHRPLVVGMTGTLMSNSHQELYNLIDLVQKGYLGSEKDFYNETAAYILYGRRKGADDDAKRLSAEKSQALTEKLDRILIERTKVEVLSDKLPNKKQHVVFCEMSELQKDIYEHLMTIPDVESVKLACAPCDCGINKEFFKNYLKLQSQAERKKYCRENKDDIYQRKRCCYKVPLNPLHKLPGQPEVHPDAVIWRAQHPRDQECQNCPTCTFFPIINKFYLLSSHAALLQAVKGAGWNTPKSQTQEKFQKDEQFAKVALAPSNIFDNIPGGYYRHNRIMDNHFELSGKLKCLHKLLTKFRNDSRVLLFSYSTKTLDLIETFVQSQGYSFLRIDGDVCASDRQRLVGQFQRDSSIFLFLLSTKAAGLGLNITAANKVIIFDVEWNPSWDKQAQDRAYRLGQRQDVEVYRLVAQGTIDELKYLHQVYKLHLKEDTLVANGSSAPRIFRGIRGDRTRKGELFGIENLLKFKRDGSFTDDIWKNKLGKKPSDLRIFSDSNFSSDNQGRQRYTELLEDRNEESDIKKAAETYEAEFENEENNTGILLDNMGDGNLKSANATDTDTNEEEDENRRKAVVEDEADGSNEEDLVGVQVNHADFFDEERGGAVLEEGDDGYEEEMGGESQNVYDVLEGGTMTLTENPQDGSMDMEDAIDFNAISNNRGNEAHAVNLNPVLPSDNQVDRQQDTNIQVQDAMSRENPADDKEAFFSSRAARRMQSTKITEGEVVEDIRADDSLEGTEPTRLGANVGRQDIFRKKPVVAVAGKTPSEIAKRKADGTLKLSFKLPAYARKKRKKQEE